MRALLIANRDDADPGHVGAHLRRSGFDFVAADRESPGDWPALDGIDLVLALGSDWSVYWDHVAPSVSAEAAIVGAAQARGVPMLGICFGGQAIAHALGGTVAAAPEPEIGWFGVESAVPALAGDGPWFQWHADRFTPPPGAVSAARSPRAEQAFRLGRTLALQFHPEVDEAIVARWVTGGRAELERHGVDPEDLVTRSRAELDRTGRSAGRLVEWFLAEVATAPS